MNKEFYDVLTSGDSTPVILNGISQPVTYNDEVVITTELLANVYETDVNNIQANFSRNKSKFQEGKHYYILQGEELKKFKNQPTNSQLVKKHSSQLYLWTERGANRHCKILDTDKAWEQFENLEDTYFKVKHGILPQSLSKELQAIILVDQKQQQLESRVNNLEDNIHIDRVQKRQLRQFISTVATNTCGTKYSKAYKEFGKKVYSAIYHDLYNAFGISCYEEIPKIKFQDALVFINKWTPKRELQLLIRGSNMEGVE